MGPRVRGRGLAGRARPSSRSRIASAPLAMVACPRPESDVSESSTEPGVAPSLGGQVASAAAGTVATGRACFVAGVWLVRPGDGCPLAELGPLGDDLGDQLFGLPAGRAVADGDDADLVLADQVLERAAWPRTVDSGARGDR